MNKTYIAAILLAATPLSACATIPDSPAEVSNSTVLDEKGAIGAELAYEAFRSAVEIGVDAGLIKGPAATKLAAIDNKAYKALQTARSAYRAGNATNYASALLEARTAISEGIALVKGAST